MRALAALALAAACGGGSSKSTPHRNGSAAPVEVVTQVQLPDAGGGKAGQVVEEKEPNDGDDVATPLPLGATARGTIDPETDVDHYRIDVDRAGVLALTLSAVEGQDLALALEDASGTVVAKSDRGGARMREGIPNFAVTAGRYTAVVYAIAHKPAGKPKKADAGSAAGKPSPVYELSAQLAQPTAGAEREPDDDRGTANDLLVGDVASGFIGWSGDVDVWKLSVEALSAKNAIDVEVSAVEGVALELVIADAVGTALVDRKAPRGQPVIVRGLVPVVAPGGAPYQYVTVKADRSNPETAYQLKVTGHVVGTDAEVEPDDTIDKPFAIPADRTIVHATFTPGDVDCFAIAKGTVERTIEVTVDTPADVDLSAELFVDGKSIAKADHAGKGAAERVVGAVPAGAQAVVRVRGAESSTAEGAYDVVVRETGEP